MKRNSKIKSIKAREILDSRGNPTVEVELILNSGEIFCSSVPSGLSKGKYEAVELRDGGKRYRGQGVLKAVRNVNNIIASKLKGKDPTEQKEIDNLMIKLDGTKNKSKLGANAILAVSMAVCRAGAVAKNLSLYKYISQLTTHNVNTTFSTIVENVGQMPRPCFNVINGGVHAGNELDFQEFMIVPSQKEIKKRQTYIMLHSSIFRENLRVAIEIYQELKKIIKKNYIDLAINVGDEGGFAPPVRTPEEALDLIIAATKNLGYDKKIKIILDVAASHFFKKNNYQMKIGVFSREGLLNYYLDLIKKYPILGGGGIEDPFAENDWQGWQIINQKSKIKNQKLLIIGDDLTATNLDRMELVQKRKACNAIIIKPNQIGTITETIEAVKLAKSFGWKIMVSHRSGETNDDFIADLAVGISADFIKAGAPARGERVAKYNRLLRIEEELREWIR